MDTGTHKGGRNGRNNHGVLPLTGESPKREFQKYVEMHTKKQVRELLEDAALVTDPLGRELLRRLADP
jgi:hypothetical protein